MKKKITYLALAIISMVIYGCKQDSPTPEEVILPEAATTQHAQVITFEEDVIIGNRAFSAIELTEGSRYIAALKRDTKAFYDDTEVKTGVYRYENNTFNLVSFGKVKPGLNSVVIEPTHGYTITVPAKIKKTSVKTTVEKNACRTWGLNKLKVKVTGPNMAEPIEKEFLGLDLHSASQTLRETGVPVSIETIEALKGYVLREIIITGTNSFVICFTNEQAFYGKWNMANENFYYTIRAIQNPIFIDGTTTGYLTFQDKETGTIRSWAKITDEEGRIFTMEYEFMLKEIK